MPNVRAAEGWAAARCERLTIKELARAVELVGIKLVFRREASEVLTSARDAPKVKSIMAERARLGTH